MTGRWFSSGTPVFSTNKADHHDITRILLKVALNTIILIISSNEVNISKKNKNKKNKKIKIVSLWQCLKTYYKCLIVFILSLFFKDLRKSDPDKCIPRSDIEAKAKQLRLPYCETSALTQEGLKECFEQAVSKQ